jgi:exodeoxyribonuclease VII small subunit
MSKEQQITYQEAVREIENILQQMESNDDADMDILSEKVKKALLLLNFCTQQLRTTEEELAQLQTK